MLRKLFSISPGCSYLGNPASRSLFSRLPYPPVPLPSLSFRAPPSKATTVNFQCLAYEGSARETIHGIDKKTKRLVHDSGKNALVHSGKTHLFTVFTPSIDLGTIVLLRFTGRYTCISLVRYRHCFFWLYSCTSRQNSIYHFAKRKKVLLSVSYFW